MYTSFRIQNFKGFRDLEFDDLARINLLAGKNNTGKTSVLEAIASHALGRLSDVAIRIQDDLNRESSFGSKRTSNLDALFYNFDASTPIQLMGSFLHPRLPRNPLWRNKSESLNWKLTLTTNNGYGVKSELTGAHGQKAEIKSFQDKLLAEDLRSRRENRSFTPHLIDTGFFASDEKGNTEVDVERFGELDFNNEVNILVDLLKTIEPRLETMKVIRRNDMTLIYGNIGLSHPIPVNYMGEGMNKVTSLILAMSVHRGGIILIDEIENGLHYSILKDIWETIDRASQLFNVQVFATTHSREVIEAAHRYFSNGERMEGDDDYDFRLHRLDRQDTGDITRTTYTAETLDATIQFDMEMR